MSQKYYGKEYGASAPENYERYFVPAIGAPVAAGLMEKAALGQGERVLDVACGTGVVTRLAARAVGESGSVSGLDINPGMLAVARTVTPSENRIEWFEAGADAMPFAEASFDVVLCQMGLQFMPDKLAALNEMHRVLAPGGRLVFNVPGPIPKLFAIMEEALSNQIGDEAARFVSVVFSLNDSAAIERLVEEAGFREVSVDADTGELRLPAPEEFFWQYVRSTPLAAAVASMEDAERDALERDIVQKWRDFQEDDGLKLQVRMVTVTALK